MILDVSVAAISDAAAAGYSNPSRAAALMELDSQASALMGATTWFQGGFDGNVTYRTKIGPVTHVVMVYEEKDCDQKAINKEPEPTPPNGGGGGGTGGVWIPPSYPGSGGDCLYGCGGTVIVGDIEQP